MGDKSVDRAAMQKATQQIETKHQQIHTLQTRLQGQMTDLSSRWHGNASTAFQKDSAAPATERSAISALAHSGASGGNRNSSWPRLRLLE